MKNDMYAKIQKKNKKYLKIGLILGFLILFTVLISIRLGRADISFSDITNIIIGKLTLESSFYENIHPYKTAIVWDIRLPRILVALVVGCGLAIAGTIFQSLLMNPLADPYTIGVSTGAAFGASIALYINLFLVTIQLPVTPFAFIGAILTFILVLKISNFGGIMNTSNMIISGIIVSTILAAGISFIKNAAGEQVHIIIYWLMGSLVARTWMHVSLVLPIILVGSVIAFIYADDLNLLCMGENDAKSLGVDIKKMRTIFLLLGSIMTAACVSVSGIIGFVGLIVPHLLRFAFSSDNKILIPLSGLLGGFILVIADNITRVLFVSEIPVGVLTTLIGGPFFIYIFIKKNKYLY